MSNKFIKISAITFLILAVLAVIPWLRDKTKDLKNKKPDNISVNLSAFTKETTSRIIIKKGDTEKILNFRDNKWFIGEDEADESKITGLFKNFADLKIKEMVSQNEENQKKFEVTKDSGFQLIITREGKDSTFFIGKPGTAVNDFYMRKEGIKNVYLVSGGLREKMEWEAEKWKKSSENKSKDKDNNKK